MLKRTHHTWLHMDDRKLKKRRSAVSNSTSTGQLPYLERAAGSEAWRHQSQKNKRRIEFVQFYCSTVNGEKRPGCVHRIDGDRCGWHENLKLIKTIVSILFTFRTDLSDFMIFYCPNGAGKHRIEDDHWRWYLAYRRNRGDMIVTYKLWIIWWAGYT